MATDRYTPDVWHCRATGETRTTEPGIHDPREWEPMRTIPGRYGVALAPLGDSYPIDRMVWWEYREPEPRA